jgi:DNA-binding response OmpR family regulator
MVTTKPAESMREPLSILIVDDEPLVAKSVAHFLESCGCQTVVCSDGHAAVEQLRAQPFGLLITDWGLPKDGGRHLLDFVRSSEYPCRIIVMTGQGNQEELADYSSLPILFLQKPFDLDVLLEHIEAMPCNKPSGARPRRRATRR